MKITFILPGRTSSGGVRCISIIGQQLLDRGHQVRILSRRATQTFRTRCRSLQSRWLYHAAPEWIRQFEGVVEDFTDIAQCTFQQDEILIAVGMAECAELDRCTWLPNLKIQYLHGSTPFSPELVKRALSLPYPKIVVASYLQDLVEVTGRRGNVIAVIHNGVDPQEYFCSVCESERDGVGMIYGNHPVKGPETTFQVIDRLLHLRPGVPIRVFSTDRRPRRIPASMYCRNPTLQRAREIYSRSLVWIIPSVSEGFALPILEAMACGCVVVATDCGGPRDIIKNGVNGFLVPVGDVAGIVSRVQLLLNDVELRSSIRIQAKETVRWFSWSRCVTRLENILESSVQAFA